MKWVAVSGSWRRSSPELEKDVRRAVAEFMGRGDGIVTGGALGVDFIATDEALKHNPAADRIKIIIPSPLEVYAAHYRQRAGEGVITPRQAESLVSLLADLKRRNPTSLVEMGHAVLEPATYYDRNTKVLEAADELLVFQVNKSPGTQDAVDKARKLGLPTVVRRYII